MIAFTQKSLNNPLNTSDNQRIFSFTRGERFYRTKEYDCRVSYYDNDLPKSARTTSFGFGDRSSMERRDKFPSPATYEQNSPSKLKKGHTFGLDEKICFIDEYTKKFISNPAPTKYDKRILGKTGHFSFPQSDREDLEKYHNKLGPGQYFMRDSLNKKGEYTVSKHRNSCCSKIGRQRRFTGDETVPPGPGEYKDQLCLNSTGEYFNSRIPSKGIRTFGKPRTTSLFQVNKNPGPGSYYNFPSFSSRR